MGALTLKDSPPISETRPSSWPSELTTQLCRWMCGLIACSSVIDRLPLQRQRSRERTQERLTDGAGTSFEMVAVGERASAPALMPGRLCLASRKLFRLEDDLRRHRVVVAAAGGVCALVAGQNDGLLVGG